MLRYVSRVFLFGLIGFSLLLVACAAPPLLVDYTDASVAAAQLAPEVAATQTVEPMELPAPPTVTDTAELPTQPAAAETSEPPSQPRASEPTVWDLLLSDDNFTMFIDAIDSAGLSDILETRDADLTVFAPTNDAFQQMPDEIHDILFSDADLLAQIAAYHVSDEYVLVDELRQRIAESSDPTEPTTETISTRQELSATVAVWQEAAKVNNAQIIDSDYRASNGVVQVIDRVLIPVSLPLPDGWPGELPDYDPQIMVWEPYPPGQPLPIGDAELVPGHPVVITSVNQFTEVLRRDGVKINVARSVRLEANGEVVYLSPLAEESVPATYRDFVNLATGQGDDEAAQQGVDKAAQQGVDYGIMTIEGNIESSSGPGAYLRRVRTDDPDSREWYVAFFAPNTNPDIDEPVGYAELTFLSIDVTDLAIPEAALFYGTVYCRDYTRYGYTCHRCRITEVFESNWPRVDQCSQ